MIGLQPLGIYSIGSLDTQYKAILRSMSVELRMPRVVPLRSDYLVGIGKNRIGIYPLGIIMPENMAIVRNMEIDIELDDLAGTQTNTIPDMHLELSMPRLFPEIEQGGHIFITVDDDGDVYNLSFEGIESE